MEEDEMDAVLSSTDPSQIALVKSLLDREKIPYFAQGEIHSAIAARIPVRFLVPRSHSNKAKEVLKEFL